MSFKKREPVLDVHPKLQGAVSDYQFQSVALNDDDFATYVRQIKMATLASALGIKAAFDANLKRLRLRVRNTPPVSGIPDGSDQVDGGTLVAWAASITKADAEAKQQLVQLAATANARVS